MQTSLRLLGFVDLSEVYTKYTTTMGIKIVLGTEENQRYIARYE